MPPVELELPHGIGKCEVGAIEDNTKATKKEIQTITKSEFVELTCKTAQSTKISDKAFASYFKDGPAFTETGGFQIFQGAKGALIQVYCKH